MALHTSVFVRPEITVTDDNGAAWTSIRLTAGGDILALSLKQDDALALAQAILEAVYGEQGPDGWGS